MCRIYNSCSLIQQHSPALHQSGQILRKHRQVLTVAQWEFVHSLFEFVDLPRRTSVDHDDSLVLNNVALIQAHTNHMDFDSHENPSFTLIMPWSGFCATDRVTSREPPSRRQIRPGVSIIEVVTVYPGFGAECDSFQVNDLRAAGTFQAKYLPSRRWKNFTSYFTESLSAWAALNRGALVEGILILAIVRGFTPVRALRSATTNVPRPLRRTLPSFFRPSFIAVTRELNIALTDLYNMSRNDTEGLPDKENFLCGIGVTLVTG